MAAVMTSHRPDGAPPPLPARDSIPNRPVTRSHSSVDTSQKFKNVPRRNHSTDTDVPPPAPPLSYRHKVIEPQGGAVGNRGGVSRGERNADVKPSPPLPQRDLVANTDRPPPIARKTFETASFVDRHTARVYSNPGKEDALPPAPPSTKTLPRRKSERQRQNDYDVQGSHSYRQSPQQGCTDSPPELPPPRLPKSTAVPPTIDGSDLERRFTFHDVSDFPCPEPMQINKKNYPSVCQPDKRTKSAGSGAVNSLGYL